MNKNPVVAVLLAAVLVWVGPASAQNNFDDPEATLEEHFWGGLYKDGGKTFYCKKAFDKRTFLISESYIYNNNWMRDHLRCGTSRQCMRGDAEYRRMTSDLHNIVPANSRFDLKRGNAVFEALPAISEVDECGFKRSFNTIEPPDDIKGDIARAMFYMHHIYGLPIYGQVSDLIAWHKNDPPSEEEKQRNIDITRVQGNDNFFITKPEFIDETDIGK